MRLTPHEQERLLVSYAATVAQRRRERGLKLNHPEAIALITDHVLEGARDGRTVAELMDSGRRVVRADEVMPGIGALIHDVQVEATFPDGTKLVTVHYPIDNTELESIGGQPGQVSPANGMIELNEGRTAIVLTVVNGGDRPVQVGSHVHFPQSNRALQFDRAAAHGYRLDIPAGTAVRFEPGIEHDVSLVPLAGARAVYGISLDPPGLIDAGTLIDEPGASNQAGE